MKFSIVTPCWNAEQGIADTALSIANQVLDFGEHTVEYIVIDGLSTDRTLEILEDVWPAESSVDLTVVSQRDSGMYDALVTGFSRVDGEVLSYLNAGDYYSPYALSTVAAIMKRPDVDWLTGMRVTYTADGVINSAKVPYSYNASDIQLGMHGVRGGGRFIQQESTFWRSALMDSINFERLRRLKLAGDLFLWSRFAEVTELEIVAAHLGGFRFHGGHLSDSMDIYKEEALGFLAPARSWGVGSLRAPVNEVLSWVPVPLRRKLRKGSGVFAWDRTCGDWHRLSENCSQEPI